MRLDRPAIVALLLAVVGAAGVAWAPAARAEAKHAAMVIDANTGQVLHAQAADEARFPASLTKMMTLYMAFELIDAGRLTYQSKIKISQEAASAAPSKLDLDPGEDITAIDAIKALVTKSANDIAIAIAEHIGGTEANFARLMTAKARQIGMKGTTFRNASGLPDPSQTTTARDMLTLALRLQDDFPRHYGLFATRAFTYNGGTHRNHNTLLGSYAGTDGIKTGYTRASGFNLVSSVRRDGRHVVAAVFGGSSAASRNAHMRLLLNRALTQASAVKTRKPMLIAKPKLAPRPQPAAVAVAAVIKPAEPKRNPVTVAAATAPPVRTQASLTPAAAWSAETPNAPAGEPAAAPVRFEIAKVRRVMVAPRLKPSLADKSADTTEEPSGDEARGDAEPPQVRPSASSAPDAQIPARATETILTKASVRSTIAVPAKQPEAVPARAFAAATTAPAVRAPSTLQQQAMAIDTTNTTASREAGARMAVAAPQPSYRLQGPPRANAVTSAPVPAGATSGFQIQVGAFASAGEAERQLATIKSRAGALLHSRPTLALPVRKGDRQLYRARFAGFDANGAANTCLELRRIGVDCFVMRAE